MYNDFENKKITIEYTTEWILLSDWHERKETINTKEQLINILSSNHHKFSHLDTKQMKEKMKIELDYIINKIIEKEIFFKTSKSWGHWWQNVNKRETKVQLFFDIKNSKYLDTYQKDKIIEHANTKQLHDQDSTLKIECQEERNQLRNKEIAIKKFREFINEALFEENERIQTEVPQHENEKRIKEKKHHWKKKEHRSFKAELD